MFKTIKHLIESAKSKAGQNERENGLERAIIALRSNTKSG
jgi:hypothetical protein